MGILCLAQKMGAKGTQDPVKIVFLYHLYLLCKTYFGLSKELRKNLTVQ